MSTTMGDEESIETKAHGVQTAVDVFTHSSTGFPGAWKEEEVSMLLDAWRDVLDTATFPRKRFDVARKVLVTLRRKGFRRVEKDVVRKQMNTLRTEYKTYLGLVKIGIPTLRPSCVDQMEAIFGPGGEVRRRRASTGDTQNQTDAVSEDSDVPRRMSAASYGEELTEAPLRNDSQPKSVPENQDEAGGGNETRRVRFQRGINVRRLIQQQQVTLNQIQKINQANEDANSKIISLLETVVELQKTLVTNVEKLTLMKLSKSEELVCDLARVVE